MKSTNRHTAAALIGVALAAGVFTACSTESMDSTTTSSTTQSNCRAAVTSYYANSKQLSDAVAATVRSVQLPQGTSLIAWRVSQDSDEPGKIGLAIDLCGSSLSTPDALRPVATAFAKAVKTSDFGNQVFSLYVNNYKTYTKTEIADGARLKDGDFDMHLWNGKPSAQAELAQWEVLPS